MEGVGFHTLRLDKRYSTKQFWRFPLHTFCYITLLFQCRNNNAEKHHRDVALQQMNFKEVICIYACFSLKVENCALLQNFSCQKNTCHLVVCNGWCGITVIKCHLKAS